MKKRNATPEDDFCMVLARFLTAALPQVTSDTPVWWSHIGHGKFAGKRAVGRMKAMGLRPGIADYIFLWPGYHVARIAFLEAKSPKGVPSAEQEDFKQHCYECGIDYAVVRTLEEAEDFLRVCGLPLQYRIDRATGAWRRIT